MTVNVIAPTLQCGRWIGCREFVCLARIADGSYHSLVIYQGTRVGRIISDSLTALINIVDFHEAGIGHTRLANQALRTAAREIDEDGLQRARHRRRRLGGPIVG